MKNSNPNKNIDQELEPIVIYKKKQKGYLASSYQQQQVRFPRIMQNLSVHQQEVKVNIQHKLDNSIHFNQPLMRSSDFENEKIKGIKALKDYYSEVSKLIVRAPPQEQITPIRSPSYKQFDSQLNSTPKQLKRVRGYLKMINGFQDGLDNNLLYYLETTRVQQPRRQRFGTISIENTLSRDNS